MRYIEMNPLRTGLVAHPRDYPWSSHRRYAYGDAGANLVWLIEHDQYLVLGRNEDSRRLAYRDLFKDEIDPGELAAIRDCTHKGWALGDERFRMDIEGLGGRRAAPAVRGRPMLREKTHK